MTVHAYVAVLPPGRQELDIREVALDIRGPYEVIVRQKAFGVCHSQLDRIYDPGRNTFTWGTHAVVDEQWLVKAPQGRPPDLGSIIGCALMTDAGAVMNSADVRAGQSVAVWGAGGVGLCAIAGASILGATPIVAVDIDEYKLKLALQFGATDVVNAMATDPVAAIRELTSHQDGTRGVDVAFDCTGIGTNIPVSLAAVRPGIRGAGVRGGVDVLVGIPRAPFELNSMDLLNGRRASSAASAGDVTRCATLRRAVVELDV